VLREDAIQDRDLSPKSKRRAELKSKLYQKLRQRLQDADDDRTNSGDAPPQVEGTSVLTSHNSGMLR
jgi:hypothetical protein